MSPELDPAMGTGPAPSPGHCAHTDLVNRTMLALSARGVMCWRNPTGRTRTASGSVFGFGLVGSGDILGVIPPNGRALAVEVKTGRGRQTPAQIRFQTAFSKRGGLYVVARCPGDAILAIEHAMGSAAAVGWHA